MLDCSHSFLCTPPLPRRPQNIRRDLSTSSLVSTPGGGNDIIARLFGQKLSESLGQPVIIENKPGAGAILATDYVAKSAPDGYIAADRRQRRHGDQSGGLHEIAIRSCSRFHSDFELGSFPLILIVNVASPLKSVSEPVAYAKQNPNKANYSSSSAAFQLATELFKQKTGAPMQMIPYKGANDPVVAVIVG